MADYSGLALPMAEQGRLVREWHQINAARVLEDHEELVLEVTDGRLVGRRLMGHDIVKAPFNVGQARWARRAEPWTIEQVQHVMAKRSSRLLLPEEQGDLDLWEEAAKEVLATFVATVEADGLRGLTADSRCLRVGAKKDRIVVSWAPHGELEQGFAPGRAFGYDEWFLMDARGWCSFTETWAAAALHRPLVGVTV